MTTSGSVNYTVNRNDIINEAFAVAGILAVGETLSYEDLSAANTTLNLMIKSWGAGGPRLWTTQEACLFPVDAQAKYQLGGSSSDHITTSYSSTALGAAAAAAATALTVTSTTGMTAADYIAITLDDNSVHWDTIASVPGATTVNITTGLASAAASGNVVRWYTTKIERAMRILQVWRRDTSDIDTQLTAIGRQEYDNLTDKTNKAVPVQYYYDPQLSAGYLYLWPTPDDERDRFVFKFQRTLEDFDASADNPDFPQEWYFALVYNLAAHLAIKYERDANKVSQLVALAGSSKSAAESFDVETTSLFIQPDLGGW